MVQVQFVVRLGNREYTLRTYVQSRGNKLALTDVYKAFSSWAKEHRVQGDRDIKKYASIKLRFPEGDRGRAVHPVLGSVARPPKTLAARSFRVFKIQFSSQRPGWDWQREVWRQ